MTGTDGSHTRHAASHRQIDAIGHSMDRGTEERLENFAVQKYLYIPSVIVRMREWEVL